MTAEETPHNPCGFAMAVGSSRTTKTCDDAVVEHLPGDLGWRISLALAGLPALILTMAAIGLPETPNSLAERGHIHQARSILEKIRGTDDVTVEMDDIIAAAEEASQVGSSKRQTMLLNDNFWAGGGEFCMKVDVKGLQNCCCNS